MGSVYRRQVRYCTRCDRRLDTTAARQACDAAGHSIEIREQKTWWIKYQVGGRPQCVSSGSDRKKVAEDLLKAREGDVVRGLCRHGAGRQGSVRGSRRGSAERLQHERQAIAGRPWQGRIENHLSPFFGGRRMTTIGTADVRAFVARRQAEGAANGSINRDLDHPQTHVHARRARRQADDPSPIFRCSRRTTLGRVSSSRSSSQA